MDSLFDRYKKDVELLKLLEDENKKLIRMVEYDWLTGVYNRGAVQRRINQILMQRHMGVLFVMDVNSFKAINDLYGHLCGDATLKAIGKKLNEIFSVEDVYGRIGGDEFVVYLPLDQDEAFVTEMEIEIAKRMAEITFGDKQEHVSMAVCGSSYQQGDTYDTLFARADDKLLQLKSERKKQKTEFKFASICKDKSLIREELQEKDVQLGAFCQEYDSFKNIYRFVERYLCRSEHKVYLILLTLLEEHQNQQITMQHLKCSIHRVLRLGDVFTQYSSCQFLIMAMDVDETAIDKMVERIKIDFCMKHHDMKKKTLFHDCIKLQAVIT